MFECVLNLSEGTSAALPASFDIAAGASLRDRHSDAVHNRSVYTLINDPDELQRDVRRLVATALDDLDLTTHLGVHPRLGVVDVVPYVALGREAPHDAVALRNETAQWIATTRHIPVFLYGPERSLPDVRRHAFTSLAPDLGPSRASPRSGAVAVGARDLLVAWNIWLRDVNLATTRQVASEVRRAAVRTLGLDLGDGFTQISCNLVDVDVVRPSQVLDQVVALLGDASLVVQCELVGLAPRALLEREDPGRWESLGLSPEATIEARIS